MIPPQIIEAGEKLAQEATIFGVSFDKLTRNELIALCAYGWEMYNKELGLITTNKL